MNLVVTVSPDCEGLINFTRSCSDCCSSGALKERRRPRASALGSAEAPVFVYQASPSATWHRGGQEGDEGWQKCHRVLGHAQRRPPTVFLSFLISIPAPFLLGVVVLGGITGMLLGFSQLCSGVVQGHTQPPGPVVPHTPDAPGVSPTPRRSTGTATCSSVILQV